MLASTDKIVPVAGPGGVGQSTYQAWLALGNVGTLQDFLDAQKGPSVTVNGIGPNGSGNITLTPSGLGAAAADAQGRVTGSAAALTVTPTGGTQTTLPAILVPLDPSAPTFRTALAGILRTWILALPTDPDGLGPAQFWRQGSAGGGYVLALTGTNT